MNLRNLVAKVHLGRPALRVQLCALYTGLALAVVVVLQANHIPLLGHDQRAAGVGGAVSNAQPSAGSQQSDLAPAIFGMIVMAVTVALAWWLAGRFLRPLRAMNSMAREISATNLNRRLNLRGPEDELTELGRTLDGLFGRLEASFESQRHFVANASHELRTPLAGQRTLLQVALADTNVSVESLRAACEEALALGAQQERLIEGLLTLASGERGIEKRQSLDLCNVADMVLVSRRQQADTRGVAIQTSLDPAPMTGDGNFIESMVANLLDNAIRHNTPNGNIVISTTLVNGQARLSISNSGPTIPGEELPRLFQPFQRLNAERTRNTDGHGLGLAIVQAIADAHGATITATPRPEGGLHMIVTFPLDQPPTTSCG
jgi:signal transduction histidine kinase